LHSNNGLLTLIEVEKFVEAQKTSCQQDNLQFLNNEYLYKDSKMTILEALLLLNTIVLKHKMTEVAKQDIIEFANCFMPEGKTLIKLLYLLDKLLGNKSHK
jgi:hypothetical protein